MAAMKPPREVAKRKRHKSHEPPIWVAARSVVAAADTVPKDCYEPLADLPMGLDKAIRAAHRHAYPSVDRTGRA
jgi:hypothetical protein